MDERVKNATGGAEFTLALLQVGNSRAEWERRWRSARRYDMAAIGEKAVTDKFGLLFEPIAIEALAVLYAIGIAAERVAHQRQIKAPVALGLPDVSHFVDEEALQ